MKKISVVLIAALVVSLLFGCGKSDDAKGTGKTTLSVWYWGEQEVPGYKAYMEEMVKRYEKKYGKKTMGVVRTTYLIDEEGVIEKVFGKVKAAENPRQMLEEL